MQAFLEVKKIITGMYTIIIFAGNSGKGPENITTK